MLNGSRFAQMTVSAANHLENHQDEIDAMNVFPVPDGDTGKNMSLTMRGAANAAEASDMLPLNEVVQKVATEKRTGQFGRDFVPAGARHGKRNGTQTAGASV